MPLNLPSGCTDSDIDRSAGLYKVECTSCQCLVLANETNEDGECEDCETEKKLE